MLNAIFQKYELFLLVMMRMTGLVVFNPVFGRRNVPNMLKAALAFMLAVVAGLPMEPATGEELALYTSNVVMFMLLAAKELIFGYLIGLIVNMYFSIVTIAGEIMDLQMGLSMSRMYDPGSNIQMPLAGSFFNIALIFMFFITNSHMSMIQMTVISFDISPVMSFHFNSSIGASIFNLFAHVFMLSLKFAFPIMAAELVAETGIGIIMRAVPQINVFVVGVQLKVIVAIFIMIAIAPVSTWFFEGMLGEMNARIYDALVQLAY